MYSPYHIITYYNATFWKACKVVDEAGGGDTHENWTHELKTVNVGSYDEQIECSKKWIEGDKENARFELKTLAPIKSYIHLYYFIKINTP